MEIARRKIFKGTRFLSFNLAGEEYCIQITRIREILAMPEITPIPHAPEYIRGVMNLRGNIIPLVDLRLKFRMPFNEYSERTCAIVVEPQLDGEPILMGIAVDTINEVLGITDDQITKLPYINSRIRSEYIQGFTEQDGRIRILLDIDQVIGAKDLELAENWAQNPDAEEAHYV